MSILIDHRLYRGYFDFVGELSYLLFVSYYEQEEMLLKDLLLKQLATFCCVINPEVGGVCSEVFKEFDLSQLITCLQNIGLKLLISIF